MTSLPLPRPPADETAFTAIYEEHFTFLRDIATYRFKLPPEAAEDVVQEVFLTYLLSRDAVRDPRAWLIGGVCNASRCWWRARGGTEHLETLGAPPHPAAADTLIERITVRQVVGKLHGKCRQTLRMHYWEGATARDVAESLETTPGYAETLIHRCLQRVWRQWQHLWGTT